jgi:cytochrome c-type biogenesis protein
MGELLAAFQLGILNMSNPCVLPLYPGFLAYLASNSSALEKRHLVRWLGVLTLLGVLVSMLLIGLLLTVFRLALGNVLAILLPVIYLFVIVMGILLVLHINPFARLPMVSAPRLRNPLLGSFLYGFLYGPMTLPCSGPTVIAAFASTANAASVAEGILFVMAFGLGFGLPLVLLPFLADPVRKTVLTFMLKHHVLLSRLSGLLLIGIGIFGLINDREIIAFALGIR